MENKGNKPRGILIIVAVILFSLLFIYGVLSICLKSDLETWGYHDPLVSENNIRGTIYDRNGKILAIQAPSYGFQINENTENIQQISSLIREYTDLSGMEIAALLDSGTTFIPLSSSISKPSAEYYNLLIEENGLQNDITFVTNEIRHYPTRTLKNIIGTSSYPSHGESGIEKLFNEDLKAVPERGKNTVTGSSLTLTIDFQMQLILETLLDELELDAEAAIYTQNGFILAYKGEAREDVLMNLVRYITAPGSSVTERALSLPEKMVDSIPVGNYLLWYQGEEIESVRNALCSILEKNGRI